MIIDIDVIDAPSVKEFNAAVKNKDAFIHYFHPQCGHCKELEPQWESLVKTLKANYKNADLLIAKIRNDVMNDVQAHNKIQGFPTIFVLKNGKKVDEYSGDRGAASLLKYVKKAFSLKGNNSQRGGKRRKKRKTRSRRKHRRTHQRRRHRRRRRRRRTFKKKRR